MKHIVKQRALCAVACLFLSFFMISMVYSHCQVPCGIYDDPARIDMMAEHITSIEKAMTQIQLLSKQNDKDYNQLVRWVNNKEDHADKLSEIVTYYFMAQRVKPVEKTNELAYAKYVEQLTTLHRMQITAMKCKQTTELANVTTLRKMLTKFESTYMEDSD